MDGIATQVFSFATSAPASQVWEALTRPALTARYLYGLAAESGWRPGATVTFTGGGMTLAGEVLAAEEPRRLSYTLAAGDDQPVTFVTWEIVDDGEGSVVRLYVDEPTTAEGEAEIEGAWRRVVAGLDSVLTSVGAGRAPGGRPTSS